jgi:glycosyltransferase involved in cell wall biosynthesis
VAPTCFPLLNSSLHLNKIKLLFVAANLESRTKGLTILLDSLNEIVEQGIEVELNLVGSGKARFKKIDSSKISVIKHGALGSQEIRNLMKRVDLLVVPSTSENFPNVILEAFAMGVVVVASKVGGIPEMISHKTNGYLFDGSSFELSKVILLALKDASNWEKIRLGAQEKLQEEFNNDGILKLTNGIYARVINRFHEMMDK